jgi:hypothetical protein
MRQRPSIPLTCADRETISRWWRFMLPAVLIVLLTLLGADQAYQKLWPSASSVVQVVDETSQTPRQVGLSDTRSAR